MGTFLLEFPTQTPYIEDGVPALHVSDGQAQHPAFMGFPLCLLPKDPMSLPQPLCHKDITSLPQSADHYAPKPSPLFLHFATDLLHS